MNKYRKKPVEIEAIQWTGESDSHFKIMEMGCVTNFASNGKKEFMIKTLEGEHIASVGDWIIKGVKGEFYPCKPDIFEMTYELVDS